jgi:hypothetical protein
MILNLILFYVTHTSIIDFDFSNKFDNLSSTNYKTLCYQVYYFRKFGYYFQRLYIIKK